MTDYGSILREAYPDSSWPGASLDDRLAEQLLADDPVRLSHIYGVKRTAAELVEAFGSGSELRSHLPLAALFHDIGYAPVLHVTGFHPLDSAIFLAHHFVPDEVLEAVLFHTGAHAEARQNPLAAPIYSRLDVPEQRPVLDALTFCDVRTARTGARTTLGERVHEIASRYGPEHVVTQNILSQFSGLRMVCSRVLQRLASAQGRRLPWLFIDVDSTLVPPGQAISERNSSVLKTYLAAGGRVTLATGKHPNAIHEVSEALDLSGPHIAGNGTIEVRDGEVRLLARLGAQALEIGQHLTSLRIPYVLYAPEGVFVDSAAVTEKHLATLLSIQEPAPQCGLPPDIDTIFKVLTFVDHDAGDLEGSLRIWAAEKSVQCLRTARAFLEFLPERSGKDVALTTILRGEAWPRFLSVGIGDSENDLPLLRCAGYAVAVANATPEVLTAADTITASCAADGVAQFVEAVLKGEVF